MLIAIVMAENPVQAIDTPAIIVKAPLMTAS
jgi:hypothetical protein